MYFLYENKKTLLTIQNNGFILKPSYTIKKANMYETKKLIIFVNFPMQQK